MNYTSPVCNSNSLVDASVNTISAFSTSQMFHRSVVRFTHPQLEHGSKRSSITNVSFNAYIIRLTLLIIVGMHSFYRPILFALD